MKAQKYFYDQMKKKNHSNFILEGVCVRVGSGMQRVERC